jgi:hypothetical protein
LRQRFHNSCTKYCCLVSARTCAPFKKQLINRQVACSGMSYRSRPFTRNPRQQLPPVSLPRATRGNPSAAVLAPTPPFSSLAAAIGRDRAKAGQRRRRRGSLTSHAAGSGAGQRRRCGALQGAGWSGAAKSDRGDAGDPGGVVDCAAAVRARPDGGRRGPGAAWMCLVADAEFPAGRRAGEGHSGLV